MIFFLQKSIKLLRIRYITPIPNNRSNYMNFQNIVAYCGLTCKGCPIYWATREPDKKLQKKMRTAIARICNEQLGTDYNYENINDCDGCQTASGKLFTGCLDCEIRTCARTRKVETCAHCPDYICEKLKKMYKTDPTGKVWLDVVKSTL